MWWTVEKGDMNGGCVAWLGQIQDLTKGSGDNHLLKALAPRGSGGMLPRKTFNFRATEMRFPAFSGAI